MQNNCMCGAAYRADRQINGATLREWARKLNVGVVALSQAERGIIDPRSLHSANATAQTPPDSGTKDL